MICKLPYKRIFSFQLVGCVGTLVNMGTLWLLRGEFGVSIVPAGAIAMEIALLHNYIGHYFITWHENRNFFRKLWRYNAVNISVNLLELFLLWWLTSHLGVHYLWANLLAMVPGPSIRFVANELLVFGKQRQHGYLFILQNIQRLQRQVINVMPKIF